MKKYIVIPASLILLALSACSNTPEKSETSTLPVEVTATGSVNSLCNSNERILFNCKIATKNKTLSVCASNDLTNSSGYLQYRYGADTAHVDLNFPKDPATSRTDFKYSPQGLSFYNGSIQYQVYTEGSTGIKVYWPKAPERNSNIPCDATTVINELQQLKGVLN